MKSLLLGATMLTSVAFLSDVAIAADAVMYDAPPVSEVAANLTGFYAGLQVGYQWGDVNTSGPAAESPELDFLFGKGADGGTGGVYAGYNWDLNNRWLVGIEGDVNWLAGGKGDNWDGSLRARGGYVMNGNTLLYGTGGLAFGKFKPDFADLFLINAPSSVSVDDGVAFGWTIGAGVEHWFTDKVSMKFEYLYADLGETWSVHESGDKILGLENTSSTVRAGIALHF